jgi:hypothetical protein
MEIITKIPMAKLVCIICKFYWDSGHEKIRFEVTNPVETTYLYYNPEVKLETPENIREILVSTKKGSTKQKFDSVYFNFEQIDKGKIKIVEHIGFGFRIWQYVYILIAMLISIDYLLKPFTTGLASIYFFFLLLIPLYLFFYFKIRLISKHPSDAKYKKGFEEHIRNKEKELFIGGY